MSSSAPLKGTSGAPGCTPDARLWVGETEIPVQSFTSHHRSGGVSDTTRRTTADIPVSWGKVDGKPRSVARHINALTGEGTIHQQARLDIRNPQVAAIEGDDADNVPSGVVRAVRQQPHRHPLYHPVHYGFIKGVGGGEAEGTVSLKIADYAELTKSIPAPVTFEGATVGEVLDWVRQAFLDGQSVIEDLTVVGLTAEERAADLREDRDIEQLAIAAEMQSRPTQTSKRFQANQHSLRDVLDWLCKNIDARWHFHGASPTMLVVDKDPGGPQYFHDQGHVDPDEVPEGSLPVHIRSNNALWEANPQFRLTARGHTKMSIRAKVDPTISTSQYPTATVEYTDLAERAQGDVEPVVIGVDATTLQKTENVARQALKNRLHSTGGGHMTLEPRPEMVPFSRIKAVPVCGDVALNSVEPLEWECAEVIFAGRRVASDNDGPFLEMTVRPSLAVDPSRIEVVESKMIQA